MYPVLSHKDEWLDARREFSVVDRIPQSHFDSVCQIAAALFDLPIAFISLIEEDSRRFKAKCSLDVDGIPRDISLSAHAILSDDMLVVEDAVLDPQFAENPLVTGEPRIRFYAGAPLVLQPGIRLGTLGIIDTKPRRFRQKELDRLKGLSDIVVGQLRQHRTEEKLRESEAQFRLLAEATTDMIVRSDLSTKRLYVSPAATALLGYRPDELIGTKPVDFVHPDDIAQYHAVVANLGADRTRHATTRQRYRRKDGSWVWTETIFNPTFDPQTMQPDGYVASVRDITERKEGERKIEHLARHDPLTDLPNRILFQERWHQALAASRQAGTGCALLYLDLDHFKPVNDRHGHLAGDALLKAVADRLRGAVRTEDTVARMGGDEFAIVQTNATHEACRRLADRLIREVCHPVQMDGFSVSVGVSIGITLMTEYNDDVDSIINKTDKAL